jgi:flagellar secretion chaperone FliS
MNASGYSQYQTQAATTASPAQLVLMLYDGALSRVTRAEVALEESSPQLAHEHLTRAQAIVTELDVTLDRERGGEMAANLASLYDFCNDRLLQANITKSREGLSDVANVLQGLRDAWEQACLGTPVGVAG